MSNHYVNMPAVPFAQLAKNVKIGDLVFIRVSARPFHAVADATGTWTNHVGVVTHTDGEDPHIGESTFPFSRTTTFSKFLARSDRGRVAVSRLKVALTSQQILQVQQAALRRSGVLYDTGFNLRSNRQFCSRYVHEVIGEATGIVVGKVETLRDMLINQPDMKLGFWRLWYLGRIPWERETITPASLLRSPELQTVFYGNAIKDQHGLQHIGEPIVF